MNSLLAQTSALPFRLDFVLYGVGALVLLVFGILVINFGMIYIRALFSGAKVTITELIALRLRRIPLGLIVDGRITAVKSGLPVSIDDLSTHFLAGGNVQMVVLALVAAKKAGINLIFDRACAIDLATKGTGKTVLEVKDLAKALQAEGAMVGAPRYPLLHQQPMFTDASQPGGPAWAKLARISGTPERPLPIYDPAALPRTAAGNASLLKLPSFPRGERRLLDQYATAFEKVLSHAAELPRSGA